MARDFPGTANNYLSVGDVAAIDITGTLLTISAWLFLDGAADGAIASKWQSGATQYIFYVDPSVQLAAGAAGAGFINDTAALSTGQWYHALYLLNGTNGKIYKNGSEVASGANPTLTNTAASLVFGQQAAAEANYLDGRLAEIGIWDVGLTVAEIASLAARFSPAMIRPQSLKGYWPLKGKADPEPDLRNSNGATMTGTVAEAAHPRIYTPRPALYFP